MLTLAGAAGARRPLGTLWLPLAGVCAPALLALVAANGLTAIPRWFAAPAALVPLVSTAEVAGDVSAVADNLYVALLETGCTVATRRTAGRSAYQAPRANIRGLQLLSGQPDSPFDRWTITWMGPRRTFPHLVLTLAGPTSADRTVVQIERRAEQLGRRGWRPVATPRDGSARAGGTMSRGFATTRWSVVLAAKGADPKGRRGACYSLSGLLAPRSMRSSAVRDTGRSSPRPDPGVLPSPSGEKRAARLPAGGGALRSFLLASVSHFLSDARDRERAAKRGGGRALIPFDETFAEESYRREPPLS